jgi:hypothetical protein
MVFRGKLSRLNGVDNGFEFRFSMFRIPRLAQR